MRFLPEEQEEFSLDFTPLIDVVFLLLIFFMVSTQFISFTRRLDIKIPEAKAGSVEEKKTKEYLIEMPPSGEILVNGKVVSLESLEKMLENDRSLPNRSDLIRADRSLPYGDVVKVMGVCKHQGIRVIGIAVK